MPLRPNSRKDNRRQAVKLQHNLRQFVINETGVEDPSPTFVQEYLIGLTHTDNPASDLPDPTGATTSSTPSPGSSHPNDDDDDDDPLSSLAGLCPTDPRAQQIVEQALGIATASPTLIHDLMRDAGLGAARPGAPSPEPSFSCYDSPYICHCEAINTSIALCPHTAGDVRVLAHEPGVNDIAAGALLEEKQMQTQTREEYRSSGDLSGTVVMPCSPQDAVACRADWASVARYQPNGVLSLQMLMDEGLWPVELLDQLPSRYHTTVTGLMRAVEEIRGRGAEEGDGDGDGEAVLNSLFVRGGETVGEEVVVYAEELVPYVGEGEVEYDREFWEGIEALRRDNCENGLLDLLRWAGGGEDIQ